MSRAKFDEVAAKAIKDSSLAELLDAKLASHATTGFENGKKVTVKVPLNELQVAAACRAAVLESNVLPALETAIVAEAMRAHGGKS